MLHVRTLLRIITFLHLIILGRNHGSSKFFYILALLFSALYIFATLLSVLYFLAPLIPALYFLSFTFQVIYILSFRIMQFTFPSFFFFFSSSSSSFFSSINPLHRFQTHPYHYHIDPLSPHSCLLVRNGKMKLEVKKKAKEDVDLNDNVVNLGTLVLVMGFSSRCIELGSAPNCLQGNRKVFYELHCEFLKLEKDVVTYGYKFSILDSIELRGS